MTLSIDVMLGEFVIAAQEGRQRALALSTVPESRRVVARHESSSPTLVADVDVLSAIQAKLAGKSVTILSEDGPRVDLTGDKYFAILDPLDGTTNYGRGSSYYAVSLAGGRVKRGAKLLRLADLDFSVVVSASGVEFTARRGAGAFVDGHRVAVSDVTEVGDAIVRPTSQFERANPTEGLRFLSHLYLGSTALELLELARGSIDAYIETKHRKVFDFAAGLLAVLEAGGLATDLAGRPLEDLEVSDNARSQVLAAATPELHRSLLAVLRADC